MKRYVENEDGWSDIVQPVLWPKLYRLGCCDCGLVHDIEFKAVKGVIQFRARRNNRSTSQMRRYSKYPCK